MVVRSLCPARVGYLPLSKRTTRSTTGAASQERLQRNNAAIVEGWRVVGNRWKRANKWLRFNCQAQKGVEAAESSHRIREKGKGNGRRVGEDRIGLPGSITKIECSLTCQWARRAARYRTLDTGIGSFYTGDRSSHIKSGDRRVRRLR